MKTFRSIVEADVSNKEGREVALKAMRKSVIKDLGMSYIRADEITVKPVMGRIDVEVTNFVLCTHFVKEHEWMGETVPSVSIEFKVPVISKLGIYGRDNAEDISDSRITSSAYRAQAEVECVKVDGKEIKLDKKTATQLVNAFKVAKLKPITVKDFAKKERSLQVSTVLQYPELKKAFEKLKKQEAKEKLERAKAEDEAKFKAIKAVAKKERVDASLVVLDAYNKGTHKYAIMDKPGFEYDVIANLIWSFKENSWAAEGNYRDEERNNENVINSLRKLNVNGTFVYHTGPQDHEVRVNF